VPNITTIMLTGNLEDQDAFGSAVLIANFILVEILNQGE
jgi:hypothetical protein